MNRSKTLLSGVVAASLLAAGALFFSAPASQPAHAATPQVLLTPVTDLRFGTFIVFGSGARTVTPAGAISDVALVPLEGTVPGPARFTISYDRGNESKQALDIELELILIAMPPVQQGGVQARLSAFQSDLPGGSQLAPGQVVRVMLTNCRTRVCSRAFNVGARLDVTRQQGGASLSIPIPMQASVVSVVRQGR